MTLKMNDATKNARLYDVNCTADAQGMNLWGVVSKVTLYSTPSGKELPNSFILAFTTFDTSKELEPGNW